MAVALVLLVYVCMEQSGPLEQFTPNAADAYYNLLIQGFQSGQLSLKKAVPPEFAQLSDPYNAAAHLPFLPPPYRLFDLSYYKGKFYLYFGVTPALILFWPYAAVTGHYLFHRQAVAFFFSVGFLAATILLRDIWRRYFSEVSLGMAASCAVALGLATGAPVLLSQADVYQVAISCGYMLTMLALLALWHSIHQPGKAGVWLVVAGLLYGLAIGARPNLALGAVILLMPLAFARREGRQVLGLLLAVAVPILLTGLGLTLYNYLRFDNPFEFGIDYQLTWNRQVELRYFDLRYIWFNFRVYLLEPGRWRGQFPFLREIAAIQVPVGHGEPDKPFGVFANIPLTWFAWLAPLGWRNRLQPEGTTVRWFVASTAWLFVANALMLLPFTGANFRYQVDFLPSLILLAVLGFLGLDRLVSGRIMLRRCIQSAWLLLLVCSVAFNVLASTRYYAEAHYNRGALLQESGKAEKAITEYQQALWLNPDIADAHYNLGNALAQLGRFPEAIGHFRQAVRAEPSNAEAHYRLAIALERDGRQDEAAGQYDQARRLNPNLVRAPEQSR
jgi:tetratricopeptide (TPR) repeat protein